MTWHLGESMLPVGTYTAQLHAVKRERSKAGNDMTVLVWSLVEGGKAWLVKDYLVDGKSGWKLDQLAAALGLAELNGPLSAYVGRLVQLRVGKQATEEGERHKITGYLRPRVEATS